MKRKEKVSINNIQTIFKSVNIRIPSTLSTQTRKIVFTIIDLLTNRSKWYNVWLSTAEVHLTAMYRKDNLTLYNRITYDTKRRVQFISTGP